MTFKFFLQNLKGDILRTYLVNKNISIEILTNDY